MQIKPVFFTCVLGFTLAVAATTPRAEEAAPAAKRDPVAMSVADISACMRSNIVDRGALRDFKVVSFDREGKASTLKVKLFWKPAADGSGTRMTLQVLEPENYAGTSYLLRPASTGEELQVYLPALDRVQPISGTESSQPLWGTDFTFAEVQQVQGELQKGTTTREADGSVFERKAFVLDTTTDQEKTGYTHVRSYVDQATCTLLKAEMFGHGKDPRKVMEADLTTLLQVDPWWLMLGYGIKDLRTGTRTDLKLSDVYLGNKVPESLFTPEGFHTPQP